MNDLLYWLLHLPSAQRNAIIKSAKRMARTSGTSLETVMLFIYDNRTSLRTKALTR